MGLAERLRAAEQERRRAAGAPLLDEPDRDQAIPEPVPGERPITDSGLPAIDLTPPAPVIDLRPAPGEPAEMPAPAGFAEACPNCGGPTRLDVHDVVSGVEQHSCLACGHLFQVTR